MGQRLIMNIYEYEGNSEPILNVYYHWSAYTRSAYEEAKIFLTEYNRITRTGNLIIDCLNALESAGARVCEPEESEALFKDLNFEAATDSINRNNGIIAYTESGKEDNEAYGEGTLNVYMRSETIANYCTWATDEDEILDSEIDPESIPLIDQDLEYISFNDLENTLMMLNNMVRSRVYIYKTPNNEYISLIE